MRMRGKVPIAWVVVLVAVVLGACAPAAGQQAFVYLAVPQEVLGPLIQVGPSIPTPTGYDFLSIEVVTEYSVTFVAPATTGWQVMAVLGGTVLQPLRVTVSTYEQSGATSVAISVTPVGDRRVMVDNIVEELDRRFRRAM